LWQMCFNRIVANGKLATLFGQGGVRTDRFFRTIRLRRGGERDWESLDEETRSVLEAYSEGVNAYLGSHRNRLPLEFTILSVDPEPWTPVDTLTWTKMMSLSLGLNMTREMLRTRLVTELGEPGKQIAHRLLPPYPEDAPFIIQELTPPADEVTEAHRERGEAFGEAFVPQFGLPAPGIGSNSWVVAGSRTASG
ncbi:MAG: penicillin acylase family protein, partial [bacterium]|nr:penicillin acylase family protein [bacterium]